MDKQREFKYITTEMSDLLASYENGGENGKVED